MERDKIKHGKLPNDKMSKMQQMAYQVEQHYLEPSPKAHPPAYDPFPEDVTQGTWVGLLGGALAGLVFGLLMLNGTIVIPNVDNLYSMTPFTFGAFWTLIGAAAGLAIGGIITMIDEPDPDILRERPSRRPKPVKPPED